MTPLYQEATLRLEVVACGQCGIAFGAPASFIASRREDGKTFYCPNGHPRVYKGGRVDQMREETEKAKRTAADARKKAKEATKIARDALIREEQRMRAGLAPPDGEQITKEIQRVSRWHSEQSDDTPPSA